MRSAAAVAAKHTRSEWLRLAQARQANSLPSWSALQGASGDFAASLVKQLWPLSQVVFKPPHLLTYEHRNLMHTQYVQFQVDECGCVVVLQAARPPGWPWIPAPRAGLT